MKTNYSIAEETILPSGGKVYDQTIDPNIKLKSMTTKHEMWRLSMGVNPYKVLCDIIDDCTVSGGGISAYDMCLGDYIYLLYKLRAVTYGSTINFSTQCPHCKNVEELEVNIDDFAVINKLDEYNDCRTIILPVSNNEVTLKLQTPRILDRITNNVKEFKIRRKGSSDDPTILYTIESCIEKIDGVKPNPANFDDWVKDLPMLDTLAIMDGSEKINELIGLDTDIITFCPYCGKEHTVKFKVTPEFFRPTIKK